MQMPVFLVLFLAPVYVPLALLVGLGPRGRAGQPVHAADRGGRDFISGTPANAALAYGIALGLLLVFGFWAVRGLRSAEAAGG